MKKIIIGLTAILSLLLFTGCTQEKPVEKKEKVEESQKSTLQSEDVYNKYLNATKELKSLHILSNIKESTSDLSDNPQLSNSISIEMSLINDADKQLHLKMTSNLNDANTIMNEMYLTKDNFYMMNPENTNEWYKLPSSKFNDIAGSSMNMVEEFDKMSSFKKEFSIAEQDNNYLLTLVKKGDDLTKLIEEMNANGDDTTVFEMIEVDEFAYSYFIDKDTYLPSKVVLSIKGQTKEEPSTPFSMEIETTYDQFNSIKSITVPEDIGTVAKDLNF